MVLSGICSAWSSLSLGCTWQLDTWQPMSIIKTIWSTLFRITPVLTVETLRKRTNVLCGQNETSLNVPEDCTWTTPASMAVCVEVRNVGDTKRINKGYNLPATNYLKVFYITHVLIKINFLLWKYLYSHLSLSVLPLNVLFSKPYL